MPLTTDANNGNPVEANGFQAFSAAAAACEAQDSDSRLPNREELASMYYNGYLLGMAGGITYWSSSVASVTPSPGYAWSQYFWMGQRYVKSRNTATLRVRCIKR